MTLAPAPREVIVLADADAIAHAAAERLLRHIPSDDKRVAICLTGGSSPERLYQLLGSSNYSDRIPWHRIHWFIGDDRFVPMDDPLSNIGMARRLFLDRCAPAACIHPIPTGAASPDAAARLYEKELRDFHGADMLQPDQPLFDLVLMGLGPDGHTASLFPGSPALAETGRWVVGVPEANVAPFVPRVTLTFPALGSCREMVFLVNGVAKRDILARVLADEDLPAARAHSMRATTWLVDRAAAGDAA
jgi:6-phosphogluconolactonase